jgi:hypothetical protein
MRYRSRRISPRRGLSPERNGGGEMECGKRPKGLLSARLPALRTRAASIGNRWSPYPIPVKFIFASVQIDTVYFSTTGFSRQGRTRLRVGYQAGGDQVGLRNRPPHNIAARFIRVELHERRSIQVKNQPRSSRTIWARVFCLGRIRIGVFAPRGLPPLPRRMPGISFSRRNNSCRSGSSPVSSASASRRTIGRPRDVTTTSRPARAAFRYRERFALKSRTDTFMSIFYILVTTNPRLWPQVPRRFKAARGPAATAATFLQLCSAHLAESSAQYRHRYRNCQRGDGDAGPQMLAEADFHAAAARVLDYD